MRVQVEDEALLAGLTGWLGERGWPVVEASGHEAVVLLPWEQDEFAAALRLRADLAVWQAANDSRASVDAHVWA
jgi:hypothetical protein